VIFYDFSKLLQGVICPVLESSGGKKSILGVMCSNPHRLGGEVVFFLKLEVYLKIRLFLQ
jgi:hypothetical protein